MNYLNQFLFAIGVGLIISGIFWVIYIANRKFKGHHMSDVYKDSKSVFNGTLLSVIGLLSIGIIGSAKEIHPYILLYQFYSNILIFGLCFYLFQEENYSINKDKIKMMGVLIFIDLYIKLTVYILPNS